MMWLLVVSTVLALQLTTGLTADGQSRGGCAWNQYYDENMDNCGPCHEICDAMTLTKTEEQCRAECADYLVSKSCRSDQYFDEMVKSCAPCAELCHQGDAKGTSEDCLRKCPKHSSLNPPVNSQPKTPGINGRERPIDNAPSSSPSSSSWFPGIIASVSFGVLAVVAISGLVVYQRYNRQAKRYNRQARNNPPAAPGNDVTGNGRGGGGGGGGGDVRIPMEPLLPAFPVQVSSEDVGAEDICLQRPVLGNDDRVDRGGAQVEFGHAECDPVAPSSAACLFVRQQQSS